MSDKRTSITTYLYRPEPRVSVALVHVEHEVEASGYVAPGEVQDLEVRINGCLVPVDDEEAERITDELYAQAGEDDLDRAEEVLSALYDLTVDR